MPLRFSALVLLFSLAASAVWAAPAALVFACSPTNDLYRATGGKLPRYDTPSEAVRRAPARSGVLLLADGYPQHATPVDAALFEQAARKQLRLYVEFPEMLPGLALGEPKATRFERAVVASDAFGPALARLRILAVHDCRYQTVMPPATSPDLVIARVAGFDTAVYGLPREGVSPILFVHSAAVMAATTKLSHFQTGRYAPAEAWPVVWDRIFTWLSPGRTLPPFDSPPNVSPSYSRSAALGATAEAESFRRGVAWHKNARLFLHPSWTRSIDSSPKNEYEAGAPPDLSWPLGDGSLGMLEGIASKIRQDGSQSYRWNIRNDVMGETSLAMALSAALDQNQEDGRIAANLVSFAYEHSLLANGPRADPKSASYGLVGWSLPTAPNAYYGDDNARSLLGALGAAAVLKTGRWDQRFLLCLLANLRTTGQAGFRTDRIDDPELQRRGWRSYWEASPTNFAPHFESYLWALNLWAWERTGYQPFFTRAESAIRQTMAAYPQNWRWANGLQQERARMLLCLAWLVRAKDTPEHREWLKRIATDLLRSQDTSGAIAEELGPPGKGRYGPPASNEAYGTKEATLIQQNGDPLADLLYTTNFAFLGLHEAAAATGDPVYREAENRLAQFLVRIQVRARKDPRLDGAWFRAFEFRRWEYWASNADLGWGAWSVEAGWTQGWISSVLGMRRMKTSLWELTRQSEIGRYSEQLIPMMFPEK